MKRDGYDAVVVGAGPNGLAAAITIARAGRSVLLIEAGETVGGGARSSALTLPGFLHDNCSAVYPMAVASPFFHDLPLHEHGLQWIDPPAALAHPFDDGTAAVLYRSIDETSRTLGKDADAYGRLMAPLLKRWRALFDEFLQPLHIPHHPLALARFGLCALRSAEGLIRSRFHEQWAQGLMAGLAGHSFLPLAQPLSAAIGLVLGLAGHAVGWPIPRGGAQAISDSMANYLRTLGGEIVTGRPVRSARDLPMARAVLFDLTPPPLVSIAGDALSRRYRRQLARLRYGPGVFKMDWAMSAPIPWRAADCAKAATVHLAGTLDEMIAAEKAPWDGVTAERPYILLAQPSLFDPTRAPAGKHTVWAYCHVPRGSSEDMRARVEDQIERFAPGFCDRILQRHITTCSDMERYNANYVGGDISGGIADFRQVFFRPVRRLNPYRTSVPNWYLCSASTPPGTGVHGMCGYFAARTALRRSLK